MSKDKARDHVMLSCAFGKQTFPTEAYAKKQAVMLLDKKGWKLKQYKCPACGYWHNTHTSDSERIKDRVASKRAKIRAKKGIEWKQR